LIYIIPLGQWFPNCGARPWGERNWLVRELGIFWDNFIVKLNSLKYSNFEDPAFHFVHPLQLPDLSIKVQHFFGLCTLTRFEVRHKQLFDIDIWQHCHRNFLLICMPAMSQQLTFLETAIFRYAVL
jgi:hypothetical protein